MAQKKVTSDSVKKEKKKAVLKEPPLVPSTAIDPVELAVMSAFDETQVYLPQPIHHSVVAADKVTDILHEIPLDDIETVISSKSNSKLNKVSLDEDILKESIPSKKFTEFDRAVIESVLAQLMGGNQVMTSSMIYRAMTGKAKSEFVTPTQRKSVDLSMTKCMSTLLTVSLDVPSGPNGQEVIADFSGNVIPAERIRVNVVGSVTTAYRITSTPALYRICTKTDGLTLTPLSLLSVDMSYTRRNLSILNYLQRRIAPLIYPAVNASPYSPLTKTPITTKRPAKETTITIEYKELYTIAMEEDGTMPVKQCGTTLKIRVREIAHVIFDTWVKAGYLEAWNDVTRGGRTIIGAKLILPGKPPQQLED